MGCTTLGWCMLSWIMRRRLRFGGFFVDLNVRSVVPF